MHAHKKLLTDMLRNRFGLGDGYIGSDSGDVERLAGGYGIANDSGDASALFMESGNSRLSMGRVSTGGACTRRR